MLSGPKICAQPTFKSKMLQVTMASKWLAMRELSCWFCMAIDFHHVAVLINHQAFDLSERLLVMSLPVELRPVRSPFGVVRTYGGTFGFEKLSRQYLHNS